MRLRLVTAILALVVSLGAAAHQVQDAGAGRGEARHGLQARLVLEGGRSSATGATAGRKDVDMSFAPGDVMIVKLVLRNLGTARRSFKLRAMRDWATSVSPGAVTLDSMPGDAIVVNLAA